MITIQSILGYVVKRTSGLKSIINMFTIGKTMYNLLWVTPMIFIVKIGGRANNIWLTKSGSYPWAEFIRG